jgi:hypothetical protein
MDSNIIRPISRGSYVDLINDLQTQREFCKKSEDIFKQRDEWKLYAEKLEKALEETKTHFEACFLYAENIEKKLDEITQTEKKWFLYADHIEKECDEWKLYAEKKKQERDEWKLYAEKERNARNIYIKTSYHQILPVRNIPIPSQTKPQFCYY